MIPAVFDCSVVASGLGWRGNPRFCLDLVFGGQVQLYLTPAIWEEYTKVIPEILISHDCGVDIPAAFGRLLRVCAFVEPVPLGKQRSRDLSDDKYLAAALAANAEAIVSSDRDLLTLGKPFGIPILTPIEFIKFVRSEV